MEKNPPVKTYELLVAMRFGDVRYCGDMNGRDFSGCDLKNSILTNVNLINVNLSGANLNGANLIGANLTKTVLKGTNFTSVA